MDRNRYELGCSRNIYGDVELRNPSSSFGFFELYKALRLTNDIRKAPIYICHRNGRNISHCSFTFCEYMSKEFFSAKSSWIAVNLGPAHVDASVVDPVLVDAR